MSKALTVNSQKESLSFLIFFILTFMIGIAIPRLIAFLPSVIAVGFFIWSAYKTKKFPKINLKETILFTAIVTLAFASSLWAPDKDFSIERSIKISTIFLPALFLFFYARKITWPQTQTWILFCICSYIFMAGFLISETLSGHFIIETILNKEMFSFKLNRSCVILSLFITPVLFLIQSLDFSKIKKIILGTITLLPTLGILCISESQTAQLVFLVGLITFFIFPVHINRLHNIIRAALAIFVILLPFSINPILSNVTAEKPVSGFMLQASVIHRLEVWNFASEKALASPIYGQGIEALRFLKAAEWMPHQEAQGALHAHNAVLQIWAEFGLIGVLLGVTLLLYILSKIYACPNIPVRRLYLSVFVAALSCSLVGYGAWQGWQLGLFIALTGFSIAIGNAYQSKCLKGT